MDKEIRKTIREKHIPKDIIWGEISEEIFDKIQSEQDKVSKLELLEQVEKILFPIPTKDVYILTDQYGGMEKQEVTDWGLIRDRLTVLKQTIEEGK